MRAHAISLNDVFRRLGEVVSAGRTAVLLVVDACRNSPAGLHWELPKCGSALRSLLSDMESSLNSLTLFSVAAGCQAADGLGSNSPFAEILSRHLFEPGKSILAASADSCIELLQQHGQQPAMVGCIPSSLCFRGTVKDNNIWQMAVQPTLELLELLEQTGSSDNLKSVNQNLKKQFVPRLLSGSLSALSALRSQAECTAARFRVEAVYNENAEDEKALRRVEAYKLQRMVMEVAPRVLAFLFEACWKSRTGQVPQADRVRQKLKSIVKAKELECFAREGVDLGDWLLWDVTTFCKVIINFSMLNDN